MDGRCCRAGGHPGADHFRAGAARLPANASATVIPIPDWYFLFLYQYLKLPYASGDYIVLGTLGVTGVAFGALLLAPFLDTGRERRFYRRPIASSLMFLSLAAIIYLTNTAWTEYKHEMALTDQIPEDVQREEKAAENRAKGLPTTSVVETEEVAIVDKSDPAMALYKQATCVSCHAVDMKGGGSVPALRGVGDTHDKDAILAIIKEGQGQMPPMYETAVAAGLTEQDIDTLAGWLAKQKSEQ